MSNITAEIAEEIGGNVPVLLAGIPEIQIYANHESFRYQWSDIRYKDTEDSWKNSDFNCSTDSEYDIMRVYAVSSNSELMTENKGNLLWRREE